MGFPYLFFVSRTIDDINKSSKLCFFFLEKKINQELRKLLKQYKPRRRRAHRVPKLIQAQERLPRPKNEAYTFIIGQNKMESEISKDERSV